MTTNQPEPPPPTTIRESSRSMRINSVIEALQTPKTLQTVADELGISYYTARRNVLDLQRQGLCKLASTSTENGATLWIAGSSKPMPVVFVAASQQHHPLSTLSDAYLDTLQKGGNRTTEAAIDVLEVAADILHKVVFIQNGGILSNNDLMPLRGKLNNARRFLNSTADIAEQMLSLIALWDVDRLTRIMDADEFVAERMENNYQDGMVLRHPDVNS